MKQLDIFTRSTVFNDSITSKTPDTWELFIDGAARNNPGPAGIGIYIKHNGNDKLREGFFIGSKTNNQAEYTALVVGLLILKDLIAPEDIVTIISDSELLVKQIQGIYKVRQVELQKLYEKAQRLLQGMQYQIQHVLRSKNGVADELANYGIDKNITLPESLREKIHL